MMRLLVGLVLLPFAVLAQRQQQFISVHLSPASTTNLNVEDFSPSAALGRYLNLEAYEKLEGHGLVMQPEAFIGQGISDEGKATVVVWMADGSVSDILPEHTRKQSFPMVIHSPDDLMSVYLSRAYETYSHVFTTLPESLPPTGKTFISLTLSNPQDTAHLRSFLAAHRTKTHLAILTPLPVNTKAKRQSSNQPSQSPFPLPSPQQPISGISTCYNSLSACTNGTDHCSGHGECALAKKGAMECYVCACGVTVEGEGNAKRTTTWAGGKCERKDYSSDFVLLAGTTIVLLVFVAAAISLLAGVGGVELPSVLSAGAGGAKRD